MRERLLSFLNARPDAATHLLLVGSDVAGGEVSVASWALSELPPDTRAQLALVSECAQDHADEAGKGTYTAQWVSIEKDGATPRVLRRRGMRFHPSADSDAGEAATTTAPEEVSLRGLLSQALRHNEVMHTLYVKSIGSVVLAQRDIIVELGKHNQELLRRTRVLHGAVIDADGNAGKPSEAEDLERIARAGAWDKASDAFVQHIAPAIAEVVHRQATGGTNGAGA
jgi:hypothetical protein